MATAKLEFLGGTRIEEAAQRLVDAVAAGAEVAEGDFNELTLSATTGTTVEQIIAHFHTESEARSKAWEASDDGKAYRAEAAKRKSDTQAMADGLMAELKTLDFADDVAVLDWLDRLQDPSDHTGVRFDKDAVIHAFESRGFVSGANTGDDYREGDRDNEYRYLVGQALSCLKSMGAIHQVFGTFHERWKAKFLTAA